MAFNSRTVVASGVVGTTAGSVIFVGSTLALAEDNANFFWDATNKRLGVGTATPSEKIHSLTATAGSAGTTLIEHTDNTNAASDARLVVKVGGASAGDPHIEYLVAGGNTWAGGVDNSDSDAWILALSTNPGTNNRFRAATDGSLFSFLSSNAGAVTVGVSAANTPFLNLLNIATDANPMAQLLKTALGFGAGGATAIDTTFGRPSAGQLEIVSSGSVIGGIRTTSSSGTRQAALRLNVPSSGAGDAAGQILFTFGAGFTNCATIDAILTGAGAAGILRFLIGATEIMRLDTTVNIAEGVVIQTGTTTGSSFGGATNQKISFYGSSPIAQPARIAQLTDNSGGTSGGNTIASVAAAPVDTGAASLSSTRNAVATLAAKINAIEAKLSAAGGGWGLTA